MDPRPSDLTNGLQECLVDEAIELYRGQWVLMRVTEHDDEGWPAQGYVLAHSPHREDISAVLAKEPPRSELPPDQRHQLYYVFRAYPRARSGPEYDQAVEALIAQFAMIEDARGARPRR